METKRLKAFRFDCKSLDEEGTFEGYLATWDRDEGGDVIVPGAFKVTLEKWQAKGRPVPVLAFHDPERPIGGFEEMREDEKGLYVKGRLLLGLEKGREMYELLKARIVSSMSIGYSAVQWEITEAARLLKEVRLWEGSLVVWPMNEAATVDSVKHAPPGETGSGDGLSVEPGPGHSADDVKALADAVRETRIALLRRA